MRLKELSIAALVAALVAACRGSAPESIGFRDGQLMDCPGTPNCVWSRSADNRHRIDPLPAAGDPHQIFKKLIEVLRQRPDTKIIVANDRYLRVEFSTMLFVDDGEFLLNDEQRVIEVRSASRIGYSDLGKNRRRIEEIRQALRQ